MIKKIIFSFLLILLITGIAVYFYLQGKKPLRDGELQLPGLSAPVTVSYDLYGVPHIKAQNDSDLFRAFGYVHAQDRLFQMEMSRRLSQGKLAEIFGEDLLGVDQLFRTMGLEQHAKSWVKRVKEKADPRMLVQIESYLAGVNAFMNNGTNPIEFDLVGIPNHQYTMEDMASIAGFIAFSFAQGLREDSMIQYLSQKLSSDHLNDLGIFYTQNFEQIPVDLMQVKALSISVSETIQGLQSAGLFHGSNSWLISPRRSGSGRAILVNDPHIAFSQPSVWYEAQLNSDSTNIYGHFLGLIPMPLLGMNKTHAWGLTMFENDDMDLYVEKINPQNPEQYWATDHWKNFEKRVEVIKIKGAQAVELTLRTTRHGVLVNNLFSGMKKDRYALEKSQQPIALWWSFLNTDNQMMEAFFRLPNADTLEKAEQAASMIGAPGLNLMYANSRGDIAWWASAKLPIRPAHVNSKMFLDGASGKDDILGYYDFSHNPRQINPDSGVLYSANNQPADSGDGLITGYYAPTDRPTRIVELLAKKSQFSVEDMKKMLMDNTTPSALLFKRIAIPVLDDQKDHLTTIEKEALNYFSKWQGNHSSNEVAASIYNRFRQKLMQLIMEDEIGKELYSNFQFGFLMDRSIWRILNNPNSPWWDDINTQTIETREELIVSAWQQSTAFLKERFGDNVSQWTWQKDVRMIHQHPLGNVALLDKIFNVGPLSSEAGIEAINNLSFKQQGDELKITLGPSTRRVIDFGDIENSWGINPTGQSGVVSDPHYDDQAIDFSQGKFRHHWITEAQVKANLDGELLLVP